MKKRKLRKQFLYAIILMCEKNEKNREKKNKRNYRKMD